MTLIVTRIVGMTSQRSRTMDQPNTFFNTQYSPAITTGISGGLLL